jgi:hypothetical protein
MTVRFVAAIGAAAVIALAHQPASYGLLSPQGKPESGPAASPNPHAPSKSSDTQAEVVQTGSTDPVSRDDNGTAMAAATSPTTLSMVPRNPRLVTRLQGMLPRGVTVHEAAIGFRSQGQFVAAVHVAKNLEIPFQTLKDKIVRDQMSVAQAIRFLRPDADVSKELARARELAERN